MIADYIKAESVSQVLQALDSNQPMARILAGGTDLMQKTSATRRKKTNDIIFVDIKNIEELKGIRREGDCLIIGSAVTLDELMRHEAIAAYAPDLIKAAGYVGSMELRNRATVGGNICTKNPAADLLVPLLALKASIEVCELSGRKEIPVAEVIGGRLKGFGRRNLITSIKVPAVESYVTGYCRWSRESMGRAYLSVMAVMQSTGTDEFYLRIVVGGAGVWPKSFDGPVSRNTLENMESCRAFSKMIIQEQMGAVDNNDVAYKEHLARVLVYEVLNIALKGSE
ncbi:MAG: FAD binding domain-containing protein [Syntrophomonas sp.]